MCGMAKHISHSGAGAKFLGKRWFLWCQLIVKRYVRCDVMKSVIPLFQMIDVFLMVLASAQTKQQLGAFNVWVVCWQRKLLGFSVAFMSTATQMVSFAFYFLLTVFGSTMSSITCVLLSLHLFCSLCFLPSLTNLMASPLFVKLCRSWLAGHSNYVDKSNYTLPGCICLRLSTPVLFIFCSSTAAQAGAVWKVACSLNDKALPYQSPVQSLDVDSFDRRPISVSICGNEATNFNLASNPQTWQYTSSLGTAGMGWIVVEEQGLVSILWGIVNELLKSPLE